MNIGIVTDEISPNLSFALGAAAALGVDRIEIRNTASGRVPDLSEDDRQLLHDMVDEYGFTVTAVSPGTFKCRLNEETLERQFVLLEKAFAFAEEFETDKIITFAGERAASETPDNYKSAVEALAKAALLAQKRGFVLAAENEHGCYNDTPENILHLHRDLEGSGLMLNWDPGNCYRSGCTDYRTVYEPLKGIIANVHIKDTQGPESRVPWTVLGSGIIDWASQLADIRRDMPGVDLSIETHCFPLLPNTIHNLGYVKKILEGGGGLAR